MDARRDATGTADRRADARTASEAPVRMTVHATALEGSSDNVSRAGLLFFAEEPLRVSVEIHEPEGPRVVEGRLVRVQRMSDTTTGYAVELDLE